MLKDDIAFETTKDTRTVARFDSKYTRNDGCWEWIGLKYPAGYGYFCLYVSGKKYGMRSNRYAWMRHRGPILTGLLVLHSCDNRSCVNPDHLWLGTNDENMADMVRKKRQMHGERHHKCRLTLQQVREIRALDGQLSQAKIGAIYGIRQSHVHRILRGLSW